MQNRKAIKADFQILDVLKVVAESYEELSVISMRKVKDSVLNTRIFLSDLSDVFSDVRAYKQAELKKDRKKSGFFKPTNTQKPYVKVLLSPNGKLYGDIVPKVYRLFSEDVVQNDSDIVVVGRVGRDFFKKQFPYREFTYFDVPDTDFRPEDLRPLAYHLLHYEKVHVYFGRFEGLLTQNAVKVDITGEPNQPKGEPKREVISYILEPSVDEILGFFEQQIFASLLKQSVHEYQLARNGSRIQAMERALQNIDDETKKLRIVERRVERFHKNKKQLEAISGVSVWNV